MDSVCDSCGFLDHTTENCMIVMNLQNRQLLATVLPSTAPRCAHHDHIVAELEKATRVPVSDWLMVPQTPATTHLFHQNITSETALLPICVNCTRSALGTADFEVQSHIDICRCASNIVGSDCWFCTLEAIQSKKASECEKRLHSIDLGAGEGRDELVCACGDFVPAPELARKCVGCGGIVTKPFRNFMGDELEFEFASLDVKTFRWGSGSPTSLESLRSEVADRYQDHGVEGVLGNGPAPLNASQPLLSAGRDVHTNSTSIQATNSVFQPSTFPNPGSFPHMFGFSNETFNQYSRKRSSSTEAVDSVMSGLSPSSSTLAKLKPIFTDFQSARLKAIGLDIPERVVPAEIHLTADQKIDVLMLANRFNKIELRKLDKVLKICGFPDPMKEAAVSKIREELREQGKMPKCVGVLYVMRQKGWARKLEQM